MGRDLYLSAVRVGESETGSMRRLHGFVCNLLPDVGAGISRDRILYRRESSAAGPIVLIQAPGIAEGAIVHRRVDTKIHSGSYRFRLDAAPVCQRRGKSFAIENADKNVEYQMRIAWLREKALNRGFSLDDVLISSQDIMADSGMTILRCRYDGVLTVRNAEKFENAIRSGVGRHKPWGMGLLSLIS